MQVLATTDDVRGHMDVIAMHMAADHVSSKAFGPSRSSTTLYK